MLISHPRHISIDISVDTYSLCIYYAQMRNCKKCLYELIFHWTCTLDDGISQHLVVYIHNAYCIQNSHSIIKWFTHYVVKDDNMKKHGCV